MKTLSVIGLALFASSAQAALPPYWDSVKRIEAVLNSDFASYLHGAVMSVNDLGNLRYQVVTSSCAAYFTLRVVPSNKIGPTKYEVASLDETTCIDTNESK